MSGPFAQERIRRATRRSLLGAAAAGTVAATVRFSPAAALVASNTDVVVIGAGFAGLQATSVLAAAGVNVLLLEARDRVGGRVVNLPLPGGGVIDGGGQYIGPTQDRMYSLVNTFGVKTFPTFDAGKVVTRYPGPDGNVTAVSDADLQAYDSLVKSLQALADEVPVDAPWTAARASEWDSQTLQTWLDTHAATPVAAAMLTTAGHTIWGAEPRDLSLLFVLFYIAAAGNAENPGSLQRLLDVANGAQAERLVGGTAGLAEQIAQTLGERVRLNTPVTGISVTGSGVQVVTADDVIAARRVIVAVPPPMVAAIEFDPPLPALRAQLLQHWPMGSIAKCQAVYPTPFWREDGLSGESLSDQSPIDLTFDNSPVSDEPGILLGFMGGQRARMWSDVTDADRRHAVLGNFSEIVGALARDSLAYLEVNWSQERWTRGGPVATMAPGTLLDFGPAIREPVGPIHWAGTETATYWNGYMEGAVRSGERAAAEVLKLL